MSTQGGLKERERSMDIQLVNDALMPDDSKQPARDGSPRDGEEDEKTEEG